MSRKPSGKPQKEVVTLHFLKKEDIKRFNEFTQKYNIDVVKLREYIQQKYQKERENG